METTSLGLKKPTLEDEVDDTINSIYSSMQIIDDNLQEKANDITNLNNSINNINIQLNDKAKQIDLDYANKNSKYIEHILPSKNYIQSGIFPVSAFGDSITAGYAEPNVANWYPSIMQNKFINNLVLKIQSDTTNYYLHTGWTPSTCATYDGTNEYTLTRSAGDENPRFLSGIITIDTASNYKFTFDIDNSLLSTAKWNARIFLLNSSDAVISGIEIDSMGTAMVGYNNVSVNLGTADLKLLYPTLAKIRVGIQMVSNGITSTIKAKNLGLYKSSDYIYNNPSVFVKAGVTSINNYELSLASTSGEFRPRFTTSTYPLSLIPRTAMAVKITVDVTNCIGKEIKPRFLLLDNASATIIELNTGSVIPTIGGIITLACVVDINSYMTTYPNAVNFKVGATLEAGESGKTAIIKSISFCEVTSAVNVFNDGVSGNMVPDGIARINNILAHNPKVCLIAFGTNDIRNGVALSNYLNGLQTIIDTLKANNCIPILATISPLASDQTNYTLVPTWNIEIKYFASKQGVRVWDRWWALGDGDLQYIIDGRHPTTVGYKLLGETAYSLLIGERNS